MWGIDGINAKNVALFGTSPNHRDFLSRPLSFFIDNHGGRILDVVEVGGSSLGWRRGRRCVDVECNDLGMEGVARRTLKCLQTNRGKALWMGWMSVLVRWRIERLHTNIRCNWCCFLWKSGGDAETQERDHERAQDSRGGGGWWMSMIQKPQRVKRASPRTTRRASRRPWPTTTSPRPPQSGTSMSRRHPYGSTSALLTLWLDRVVYRLWKEMKGERCKKVEEGRRSSGVVVVVVVEVEGGGGPEKEARGSGCGHSPDQAICKL